MPCSGQIWKFIYTGTSLLWGWDLPVRKPAWGNAGIGTIFPLDWKPSSLLPPLLKGGRKAVRRALMTSINAVPFVFSEPSTYLQPILPLCNFLRNTEDLITTALLTHRNVDSPMDCGVSEQSLPPLL